MVSEGDRFDGGILTAGWRDNRRGITLDPKGWTATRAIAHRMVDDTVARFALVRYRRVWQPMTDEALRRFQTPVPCGPTPLAGVDVRAVGVIDLPQALRFHGLAVPCVRSGAFGASEVDEDAGGKRLGENAWGLAAGPCGWCRRMPISGWMLARRGGWSPRVVPWATVRPAFLRRRGRPRPGRLMIWRLSRRFAGARGFGLMSRVGSGR